jgi:hypothetical protein
METTAINENYGILMFCATKNPPAFNYNKALEEAGEFSEVLIKLQTKHLENPKRPDKMEAIKEFGDLQYRGVIALMTLFPDKSVEEILTDVTEHIETKLGKLIQYRDEGKYHGGL